MSEPKRVMIGRINGLYGVQGWVKIFSYTSPITSILNYSPWQLGQQGHWQTILVQASQVHGKGIIAQLTGYHDRNQATRLLGADIAVDREQLPPTQEREYYWTDLIGLTVINQAGVILGEVQDLIETGANDVLILTGERERLIPFVLDQVILEVNLTQQQILVDWEADF